MTSGSNCPHWRLVAVFAATIVASVCGRGLSRPKPTAAASEKVEVVAI